MVELIVFILMIVAFWLHTRLAASERTVRELSGIVEALEWRLDQQSAPVSDSLTPEPEPKEPTEPEPVSVPRVALRRGPLEADEPAAARPSAIPSDDRVMPAEQPDELAAPGLRFSIRRPDIDFEELFGRRLPIWLGGIALAVAGVFLVRWSIERGLLSAGVRVAFAFAFGIALLGAAEIAYRQEHRLRDPRVRQALAGAGLATLYAAFYLAGTQYGLIGQSVAFAGLALVTGLAIVLSYRFGVPSVVLGLVGGFAAPLLVGGEEANLPVLAIYLGLVTAGLVETGRRQHRPWLGAAALAGGLLWGLLLLASGDVSTTAVVVVGLYLAALGSVLPGLLGRSEDRAWRLARPLSAVAAALQAGVLVSLAGHAPLAWAMYGVLATGLAVAAYRTPTLRDAMGLTAVIALVLLATWSDPPAASFALAATGIAILFAALPLAHVWTGKAGLSDRLQAILVPAGAGVIALGHFDHQASHPFLALGLAMLAGLPAIYAYREREAGEQLFALALGASGLLAFLALVSVTPDDLLTIIGVLAGAAILWFAWKRRTQPLIVATWVMAAILAALVVDRPDLWQELEGVPNSPAISLLSWAATAIPFLVLALVEPRLSRRRLAEGAGALLVFAAFAQIVPFPLEAWLAAGLAGLAFVLLKGRVAGMTALMLAALFYAVAPLTEWLSTALGSLAGAPVLAHRLPDPLAALRLLLPVAIMLGLIAVRLPARRARTALHLATAMFAAAVLHILYKQVFAIETLTRFTALGLMERTVWQAMFVAAGVAMLRFLPSLGIAGLAAIGFALAHFAIYTLGHHNPLFEAQMVGPVPVANLLTAAYAVPMIALLVSRSRLSSYQAIVDAAVMALVALFMVSLLRQAFAGTVLVEPPLSQFEDLLRSAVGVALAAGFLWLGWVRKERSWRVGSLVFALVTVVKVFVFDTAGLEGLLRIASFAGLGASLIALGWVYSRLLSARTAPEQA